MKITSPAFKEGEKIPVKYTADGQDVSPALAFEEVPADARSLALVVEDPDAPMGTWDHWVVFNIPAGERKIEEGATPEGRRGKKNFGKLDYGGPAPPSGTHRYKFKLYALDKELEPGEGSAKEELQEAMEGNILASAVLMGTYSR